MARKHRRKLAALHKRELADARPSSVSPSRLPHNLEALSPASRSSAGVDLRPSKRLKTDHQVCLPSASTTEASTTQTSKQIISDRSIVDTQPTTSSLPTRFQHLQSRYNVSTMSIISSSKITRKIKLLLDRVQLPPHKSNNKPGIVVIESKAAAASKIISVVEIAKNDISKRGGKWYQYSNLRSELLPLKQKQKQRAQTGGMLADVSMRKGTSRGTSFSDPQASAEEVAINQKGTNGADPEEEEEAFETLQQPTGRRPAQERSKVRATPILTIYFSSTPVPELKDLYGQVMRIQMRSQCRD